MKNLYYLIVAILLFSCNQKEIQISNLSKTKVGEHAASELNIYLNKTFNGVQFSHVEASRKADIQLVLSEQAKELGIDSLPTIKESFKIIQKNGQLMIIAPDDRGLLNASYALLENLGHGFYISGDVNPKQEKWTGFNGWEIEDTPLISERFLFNWHNFLSGCTAWNFEDWKMWIDQANKMRYNGIMVHAYGNNPMFSFNYLGEKKQTGYLNNTASGRDWGNQHVNDVRRLVGGEIFDAPIFGAKASMVSEENKEREATQLMQSAFDYAKEKGTKIIFALDFDTWMANPRNILEKLPKEAIFELRNGHLAPNPDHPEGYKYLKQLVKSLVEMYPQIGQLSVWHRTPSENGIHGSVWMSFPYEKFPANWKNEYHEKLKENPELMDNQMATGTFAFGKLIAAIQKVRDEIKPDLEITSGSWRFGYVKYADVMYPKNVPLLPLDWEIDFNTPSSKEILAKAGKNREMYPIIWAHHDDHRYIGRPYTPWENLSSLLEERNSKGFGVIHWTTRPLDLFFTSSANQVWECSKDEPLITTIEKYVKSNFGDSKQIVNYYYQWLTDGPMFGRETSDHFVDLGKQRLGHKMESWEVMKEKAQLRLIVLKEASSIDTSITLQYQKEMEEFYISFFENQQLIIKALDFIESGKTAEARTAILETNPDKTIQKYVDATKLLGFTPGEKALVFSMNTRWKADFINLRQQLGIEVVRYKFAPTQHDILAQAEGHFTYFIDNERQWWRCLWENELIEETFTLKNGKSALHINNKFSFPLTTFQEQALPAGNYIIKIIAKPETNFTCSILEDNQLVANLQAEDGGKTLKFAGKGGDIVLTLKSLTGLDVSEIEIIPENLDSN